MRQILTKHAIAQAALPPPTLQQFRSDPSTILEYHTVRFFIDFILFCLVSGCEPGASWVMSRPGRSSWIVLNLARLPTWIVLSLYGGSCLISCLISFHFMSRFMQVISWALLVNGGENTLLVLGSAESSLSVHLDIAESSWQVSSHIMSHFMQLMPWAPLVDGNMLCLR